MITCSSLGSNGGDCIEWNRHCQLHWCLVCCVEMLLLEHLHPGPGVLFKSLMKYLDGARKGCALHSVHLVKTFVSTEESKCFVIVADGMLG